MKSFLTTLILLGVPAMSSSAFPSPAEMLASHRQQSANLLNAENNITGELFAWQANYNAEAFQDAYLQSRDPEYLRAAQTLFDGWMSRLFTDPEDGFRGWVGPYIYDKRFLTDALVSDAILTRHLLRFAKLVLVDEPALAEEFGDAARRYAAFARHDILGKWVDRGTFHYDGPYGYFVTWPLMFTPDNLGERQPAAAEHARLGYQLNKQTLMGEVALLLWQIERDEDMRDIATRIARLWKSRLNLFDGHYTWNYWEPVYEGDIWSVEENRLSHWIGTHPHRHYQFIEIRFVVASYAEGLVFDETDIQRLVRTHDGVMWNGDLENPDWLNSDNAVIRAATGTYTPPVPPEGLESFYRAHAWTPLAPWSEPIRRIIGVEAAPPVPPAKRDVFHFPFAEARHLRVATVIPKQVLQGRPLHSIAGLRGAGRIRVELLPELGNRVLRELHEGPVGHHWLQVERFDTTDWTPGIHRIRWTHGTEFREDLIEILNPTEASADRSLFP